MFDEQYCNQVDHLKRAAEQKERSLNALRAQYERSRPSIRCPAPCVLTCSHSSEEKIANLEKVVRELRHEFATSQQAASQKEKSLNETIDSLVVRDERSSTSNSILTFVIRIDVYQTTKLYNYNKERTTSHTLFVFTSRSTNVKFYFARAA